MQKVNRFFEIGYLVIAIIFYINAFTTIGTNKTKALIFGAFAVMATFMYFFKRNYRKKWYENK
jgi:hypothetical protein